MEKSKIPSDVASENIALGCMMIDQQAAAEVFEKLRADDFTTARNRIIYQVGLDLFANDVKIDAVSVLAQLEMKRLNVAEYQNYIISICDNVVSSAQVASACNNVRNKTICRKILFLSQKLMTEAVSPTMSGAEMIALAENEIYSLAMTSNDRGFDHIANIIPGAIEDLEAMYHGTGITGIRSGFSKLDRITGGFQPQDLVVIAGGPAIGKSALAATIALNAAKDGKTCGYFSFEMSAKQIAQRILLMTASVISPKLLKPNKSDFEKITRVSSEVARYKIHIDDQASADMVQLRAKARKIQAQKKVDILIFDYLQLIQPSGKHGTRAEAVGSISRGLKCLAKELNIPVIALSQLSRAHILQGRAPELHDLRESGAIEQDADIVIFVNRQVETGEIASINFSQIADASLILAKQRSGPANIEFSIKFNPGTTQFYDVDELRDVPENENDNDLPF